MERTEGGSPPARSDRDLVLAFKAGDRAAYEEMYARYHSRVFGVCRRILRDQQDAEEAAQETFLRAYQALHRFNGRYQLGAWLSRIASNTSVDQLRSRSRAPLVGLLGDAEPPVEGSDPQEVVVGDHPRLAVAIGSVKPLHARALALRSLEGLSHQEIAERLGLSASQVKALLHRARSSLRKAWDRAEGWIFAPVLSLRSLFGDRSAAGSASSPFISAGSTLTPLLVEKVAATALVVAVALSGFPTQPDTPRTTPRQAVTRPALDGGAVAPVPPVAAAPQRTQTAEAGTPDISGLPRLIEETLRGHDELSNEEDRPDPGDEEPVPGGASATARQVLRDVRSLLPHGGPGMSVPSI